MGSLLSVIPVVVRRFGANVRLLAAVLIGAIIAASLMSTTSIYTDAIHELGLDYAIRERGPDAINIAVRSTTRVRQCQSGRHQGTGHQKRAAGLAAET